MNCPSVGEYHGLPCVDMFAHRGLCHDSNPDHGPWEDRYRTGYQPEAEVSSTPALDRWIAERDLLDRFTRAVWNRYWLWQVWPQVAAKMPTLYGLDGVPIQPDWPGQCSFSRGPYAFRK